MTITETVEEINRLIQKSPYSKEEIMRFWTVEDFTVDEIMAYAIVVDYLEDKKQNNKKLTQQFLQKKDDLIKKYL